VDEPWVLAGNEQTTRSRFRDDLESILWRGMQFQNNTIVVNVHMNADVLDDSI
jgi:hypothetical protein